MRLRALSPHFRLYVFLAAVVILSHVDLASHLEFRAATPPESWPANEIVSTYALVDGDLGPRRSGPRARTIEELWDEAEQVFPQPQRAQVTELRALAPCDECPEGYAGPLGEDGYVIGLVLRNETWEGLHIRLVHEFAHVLAGAGGSGERDRRCPTDREAADCSPFDGYLSTWTDHFWRDQVRPDGSVAGASSSVDIQRDLASKRYARDPELFVREWAAANPSEDFASTVSYWATGMPAHTPELEAKYRLLEEWPTLVTVRDGAVSAGWGFWPPPL